MVKLVNLLNVPKDEFLFSFQGVRQVRALHLLQVTLQHGGRQGRSQAERVSMDARNMFAVESLHGTTNENCVHKE